MRIKYNQRIGFTSVNIKGGGHRKLADYLQQCFIRNIQTIT